MRKVAASSRFRHIGFDSRLLNKSYGIFAESQYRIICKNTVKPVSFLFCYDNGGFVAYSDLQYFLLI